MLELGVVGALLCCSVFTWSVLYARRGKGQAWVPYEPRDRVPWGLPDVLLAIGLLFVLSAVALAVLDPPGAEQAENAVLPADPVGQTAVILALANVSVAVVAISALAIRLLYGARGVEFGWLSIRIWSDVRLGCVAFLALAPPVYALQTCLVYWFKSKHPLVELLQRNPPLYLVVACVVSAVLVAPVCEEYLFRGLLQGWLEKTAQEHGGAPGQPPACWPIIVSAFTFAMMHFSHGPDWIPLFFLALGLGYLYRQTHRLLPAIVVHFLLNACSLLMLLVS